MKAGTDEVTEKPPYNLLFAYDNCSSPAASLSTVSESDGRLLLTFSSPGGHDSGTMSVLLCVVRLTAHTNRSISAVLLEHSPCAGGVFVLLQDRVRRRRWDVCSSWHTPGPAFMTSSNVVEISVELNDVTDPCDFNISAMAVEKPLKGQLELWYLSSSEGQCLFDVGLSVFLCLNW